MNKRILIIEDNPQDQKIILRYLGKAGFLEVSVAENGEDGIRRATEELPDIILLDTMLPGIDGFETCRQIKQEKMIPSRVVIMTGRIDAVDAEKAQRMGADDYCVKTADCAPLLEVVTRFLKETPPTKAPSAEMKGKERQLPKPHEGMGIPWGQEKTNEAIKALYRELEKKNEELKSLDKLKSEFVAMASHELRTPLTIITSALSQLMDGLYGDVSKEQQQKILMALRNAQLLRRIIDDLLDMSKIEAKAIKLNKITFNMVELAREVGGSFFGLLKEKGLGFELRTSRDKIEIEADRDRVYQIFTNLIGNAIKFTHKGKIEVVVTDQGDSVECRVTDSGCGIAAEDLPKVFGRFQQFGKTFQPGHEGTGLGLAICKGLVEIHQGTISVQSVLNKGTTMTVQLPKKAKGEVSV